jgi:hypothetical protein
MVIGEICHIEAAEPGGARYNSQQTDEERRSFENLMLLCPTHHKIIDNVTMYSPEVLRQMKVNHESRFKGRPFLVSDELLAKIFNYDKREAIFDALTNLIRATMSRTSISFEEIMDFDRATDKADLLFEQDIIDYLDEVRTKAINLFGITQQLRNSSGASVEPERNELTQKKYDLVIWFGEQSSKSRSKFHKYLRITE